MLSKLTGLPLLQPCVTQSLGGSSEQRDVINEVCLEACLSVQSLLPQVRDLLSLRVASRPLIPINHDRLYRATRENVHQEEARSLREGYAREMGIISSV